MEVDIDMEDYKEREIEFLNKIVGNEMDEKDIKIYQILRENGRTTDTELAEELGVSVTTARRRRKKLQESGEVPIMGQLFFKSVDITYADVLVKINRSSGVKNLNNFIEDIVNNVRVWETVKYSSGSYDLLIRFFEKDLGSLDLLINEFLSDRKIVKDFNTLPIAMHPKACVYNIEKFLKKD